MHETDLSGLRGMQLSLALWRLELALVRASMREERANPYWHLQPRVPARHPAGGQWTDAVLPLIQQLLTRRRRRSAPFQAGATRPQLAGPAPRGAGRVATRRTRTS